MKHKRKLKHGLKRCAYCRELFAPKSERHIYCCDAHRVAMHRLLKQNPPQPESDNIDDFLDILVDPDLEAMF